MLTNDEHETALLCLDACQRLADAGVPLGVEHFVGDLGWDTCRLLCRLLNCGLPDLVERIVAEGADLRRELVSEKERFVCEN